MAFEQNLVRQAMQGNRQAFDMLVEQHYGYIFRFIRGHVTNTDEAFDLTQNTFVKAYMHFVQLKDPEKFEPWLRQIALNECRMARRGNAVEELSLDSLEQSASFTIVHESKLVTPSVEESLIIEDGWRTISMAIDSLPVKDREIAQAFFVDEQSYSQIETEHGISHGALGMRIHRIRKQLARKIRLALLSALAFPQKSHAKQTGGTKMTPWSATCKACVLFSICTIVWFGFRSSDQSSAVASANDDNGPASAEEKKCRDHMKELGLAIINYAQENDDKLPSPEKWCDDIKDQTGEDENVLHCPKAGDKSYGYAMNKNLSGKRLSQIEDRAATVLLYETTNLRRNAVGSGKDVASRHDDRTIYLFLDGHIRMYRRDEQQPGP